MLSAFENAFEDAAELPSAPSIKADTMCVTINRIAAGDLIVLGD